MADDKMVNFRCSPEMHARVKAAATADKRKISDWVRLQVERGLASRKTKLDRRPRRA